MNPQDIIAKMQAAIAAQNTAAQEREAQDTPGEPSQEAPALIIQEGTEPQAPPPDVAQALAELFPGGLIPEDIPEPESADTAQEAHAALFPGGLPTYAQVEVPVLGGAPPPVSANQDENAWLRSLPRPRLEEREFLIDLEQEGKRVIFCVRELPWALAADIETRAFRLNVREETFFAGEYERRETLRHAIRWIAVLPDCVLDRNDDGFILQRISQEMGEALWFQYQALTELNSDEALALYLATQHYYRMEAQDKHPVPAIVREVDMMLKFGGMNRQELRAMTKSDLERLQLILMARAEVLGLAQQTRHISLAMPQAQEEPAEEKIAYPSNFFPPGYEE